ncbi:unnamed protein product [Protopolystoma xenopodis]|uniref:Uncharacterized protein n=1 Tax=Protopolystoma xenopodis TaxID=117903 RepID=A0A448XJQ7_9PLAT|nr:unnamed protein product [Protopolystoma xenopodis]
MAEGDRDVYAYLTSLLNSRSKTESLLFYATSPAFAFRYLANELGISATCKRLNQILAGDQKQFMATAQMLGSEKAMSNFLFNYNSTRQMACACVESLFDGLNLKKEHLNHLLDSELEGHPLIVWLLSTAGPNILEEVLVSQEAEITKRLNQLREALRECNLMRLGQINVSPFHFIYFEHSSSEEIKRPKTVHGYCSDAGQRESDVQLFVRL